MKFKISILPLLLSAYFSCSVLVAATVHIPDGTAVQVRLMGDVSSDNTQAGARVDFQVSQPVTIGDQVVIPSGSVVWGAVQDFKRGKFVKFDIEGLRLPNLTQVKLRSIPQKGKNESSDEIKASERLSQGVGASIGAEFTAYVDGDVDVEVASAPSSAAPAAEPAPPPATSAPPNSSAPTPAPTQNSAPAETPAPAAETPAVTPAPAAAPSAAPSAAADFSGKAEHVTVECFSDPDGADLYIDGEYVGNTPSILKVPVGDHQIQFKLSGYSTITQTLNITSGMQLRILRKTLEKAQ